MSEAQKQRPYELLWMLWFDEKSISIVYTIKKEGFPFIYTLMIRISYLGNKKRPCDTIFFAWSHGTCKTCPKGMKIRPNVYMLQGIYRIAGGLAKYTTLTGGLKLRFRMSSFCLNKSLVFSEKHGFTFGWLDGAQSFNSLKSRSLTQKRRFVSVSLLIWINVPREQFL